MSRFPQDDEVSTGTPLPLFNVKVAEAIKKGENVLFTINTTKIAENDEFKVERQFEDIEWLHHTLVTANSTEGVIVSI